MGLDDLLEGLLGRRRKHSGYQDERDSRHQGSDHKGSRGGHHQPDYYEDDYHGNPRPSVPPQPERVVVCTNCGAQNTLGAKFCQECGQSLQPKTQVEPLAAVCKSFGAKLASQAKCCPECGSAV